MRPWSAGETPALTTSGWWVGPGGNGERTFCSLAIVCAASATTAACVCRVQCETDSQQTNKQPHHTHLWQLSSLPPNQPRGLLQRYTENAQEMQALSGPHT